MPYDILNPDEQKQALDSIAGGPAPQQPQTSSTLQRIRDVLENRVQNANPHGPLGRALMSKVSQTREEDANKLEALGGLQKVDEAERQQKLRNPFSEESRRLQDVANGIVETTAQTLGVPVPSHAKEYINKLSYDELEKFKNDPVQSFFDVMKVKKETDYRNAQQKDKRAGVTDREYSHAVDQNVKFTNKVITGERGATQTLGRAIKRLDDVSNAKGLIEAVRSGQIVGNEQFAEEMAISMASLLTGTAGPAERTIQGLIPKSIAGDAGKIKQYITSKPQTFLTKGFLDNFAHSLDREEQIWGQRRDKYIEGIAGPMRPYWDKFPELKDDFYASVKTQGSSVTPEGRAPQASPAPHGQVVKQNGITYNWNGSDYVEAK